MFLHLIFDLTVEKGMRRCADRIVWQMSKRRKRSACESKSLAKANHLRQ
jgi:hypothetical protein